MGFFGKKKENKEISEPERDFSGTEVNDDECDDFGSESDEMITREEFHKLAEDKFAEAAENAKFEKASDEEREIDVISEQDESGESSDENGEVCDETAENAVAAESGISDGEDDDFYDSDEISEYDEENSNMGDSARDEHRADEKDMPRITFAEFTEKHKKGVRIALSSVGALFAVCVGIYIYGCATVPGGVMGRNIYIEDVNVSNMTYEQALAKVKSTSLLDNCDITVVCKSRMYTINGVDVGLTARVEDTVEKAMNYGKTGNIFADGFANALQIVRKHTVMPSANVNEEILRGKLTEFGNIIYGKLEEHKLEVGDGKIICTPGHTGFSGDTDNAYEQVTEAIENENFSRIRVELRSAPPKTLTIEDIDAFAYANPQDAHFDITDNNVTVVPEVWGRYLDLESVSPLVSQICEGGEVVEIPFSSSEPAVKADELNQKLFNATLGSFYTNYGGSSANRAANVNNAASKINGKVLAPGEVFSFNDTVGKRSVANGFHEAPEYSNGQTVMGIGGGTCQVSSTLYNAVLYADLSIVSRLNHMFTVGYCPAGQDATVTDSGVDFKFSNNTDYPVKISAVTSGGRLTVSIIGTQRDVAHTVKIQNYSTFSEGNQSVRSYRMVYDPDGNLLRNEDLGKSYYMAH